MTLSPVSKFVATLCSLLVLFSAFAVAQLKIGSGNTAFADPPVPHPHTTPCKVTLYKQFVFADFNPKSFTYTPPAACPGPWAKVILKANFSINQGRQFDRTANIWIGPTNIYFGTTAEPSHDVARHWSVERDLTDYSSIFTVSQAGTVDLFNLVNQTYTGILHGSASLLFYPLEQGQTPPRTADQVIAFSGGPTGGTVALNTTTDLLEQTLTLPTNITNLYFDVFAQSQSNDEFWYTCVPNDVAGELFSCPGTAFRESEVTIDGTPAGVSPVYPWIYTGGIDPYLWRPIPGVQTMNFQPYRVNLTPFAAMLDDGQPHTIALSVFNADSYFSATASLLLYLDSNSTQITGGLTENTLAVPAPKIVENIHTAKNGNIHGSVTTRSGHNFQISGYVNTSSGPVTTTIAQNINFSNLQNFTITPSTYVQNINQGTTIKSVITTQNAGGKFTDTVQDEWPLLLNITLLFNPDGSGSQATTINQYYGRDQQTRHNGQATYFSLTQNRVTPTDTLDFDSGGNITGNTNQTSAQDYFSSNSTGYCYSRSITADTGVLTSITDGVGCN
ncbi:MAG: peptide-N(4)-(N-acetyl-beta-glucosaminyl)asparagine amidase [Acidobacteriia bacterium]|nr:peptide-N(4)-(N-acetyl-beta-glucosaminyl)asparagine amidase [Terriglobia bacterium]